MNRTSFVLATAGASLLGSLPRAAKAQSSPSPALNLEPEFDLVTPTGTIFGSLRLPATTAAKMPVVLIVPGSGPVDRNGNGGGLQLNMYRKLAAAFADAGIASVRYDKRGIAESAAGAPTETDLRFETYIHDVEEWLKKIRADGRFSNVTLVGHSEGSLLGMVAAQTVPVDAFVSLEGAGLPAGMVLAAQLKPQTAQFPAFAAPVKTILTSLEAGTTVPESQIPQQLLPLFHASVQPYLISWFKYDPRVEIAKLTVPTTIVQGTHDIQVDVDQGQALAHAAPKAKYVTIDNMTHVLTDDPGTTLAAQIQGAYTSPQWPLDTKLVSTLVSVAT